MLMVSDMMHAPLRESTASSNMPSGAASILIIDDNPADVAGLKSHMQRIFKGAHFDYRDAARLIDALELIDRQSFDIVFLDLSLLDMKGSAAVAALHAEAPNLPIIVYSGCSLPHIRDEVILCGARDFIRKGQETDLILKDSVISSFHHAKGEMH